MKRNKVFYLDTEFREEPGTIDLISIGIVSGDGREYYAVRKDFDLDLAWSDPWLKKNVLKSIYDELVSGDTKDIYIPALTDKLNLKNLLLDQGKSMEEIKSDLIAFLGSKPIIYAYHSDYDWVVFCWIFGKMIDLPKSYPTFSRDLKQMAVEKGIKSSYVDAQLPLVGKHNALVDAKWNRDLHDLILNYVG